MRCVTKVMAALGVVPVMLTQTPASALPYDPYPWCAEYAPSMGAQICGFSTWNQYMATVSGIGGFCVINQFYNPGQASAGQVHRKR